MSSGDDEWDDGPPHPREDERFAVAYDTYPGGEGAYWRDFRIAAITYYRHFRDDYPITGDEVYLSETEYADREADRALRRRVYDVSMRVAEEAGTSSRAWRTGW